MTTLHFKLDDTLHRHKKSAAALVEASGLAKATVYNIVNNKAKAVELETLAKLMDGLRSLTGESVTLSDILEEQTQPDWREEIFRNAKPLDWDEMMANIPDWTDEEKAENEDFIRILEEQRKIDLELDKKRDEKLLALFEDEPTQ